MLDKSAQFTTHTWKVNMGMRDSFQLPMGNRAWIEWGVKNETNDCFEVEITKKLHLLPVKHKSF